MAKRNPLLPRDAWPLAAQFVPLAYRCAAEHWRRVGGELEQWQAEAMFLLLKAEQAYRPDHISPKTGQPVKFITYATWAIRISLRGLHLEQYTQGRGGPGVKRLKECGYEKTVKTANLYDDLRGSDDHNGALSLANLPDRSAHANPVARASGNEERVTLRAALAKLSNRERRVILLRYYRGLTHKAVGREMGMSYARAQQVESAALANLGAALGDRRRLHALTRKLAMRGMHGNERARQAKWQARCKAEREAEQAVA
jgi:RNA polymerase sigma factor (sigma-70 family)